MTTNRSALSNSPLIRLLRTLSLPTSDYVIAGSGPLLARGWISDPSDLDLAARGAAWDTAAELGPIEPAPLSSARRIRLYGGAIEVLDDWFPEVASIDQLIESAEIIDDLPFMQLAYVVRTKKLLRRPRDLVHLKIIADHTGPGS